MKYWILAARPKTLVAGIIPVVLGSALAFHLGNFNFFVFLSALVGALAIQIGTNFVNDAADFEKGADNENRLGPPRMAALGFLTPSQLYRGSFLIFLVAFLVGLFLVSVAGWPILIIGIVSIVFAIGYTAGPFPLAYLGLGDIFVFIFFGLVAVLGTYYAHALALNHHAWILASAVGIQGVTLIAVNNLRDIQEDQVVGKKTLAVRIGKENYKFYLTTLVAAPYFIWFYFALEMNSMALFLPFLTLPLAFQNILFCYRNIQPKELNALLAKSALLQALFGITATIALVFSK